MEQLHPKDTFKHDKNSHIGISNYQLFSNPLPRYLRWEDRNSMCHSIEARVPFLDYRLVEFCHSLPIEYLDAKDSPKRLLSAAMDGVLPNKIKNRKDKKGFTTPQDEWMKKHKKEFMDYLPYLEKSGLNLLDKNVETLNNDLLFRHYALGIWLKTIE